MKNLLLIALVLLAFSACSLSQYEDKGYVKTTAEFDKIIPGTSTNKDVLELLGSPSSYSAFGDEIWYYISAKRESVAFLKPKIVDQNVVGVVFDKAGIVREIKNFSKADGQSVAFSKDKTATEGNEITLWQQLLGNLGRFNSEGGLPGQRSGSGGNGR